MKITLQARPIRCALCHDEAYGALARCALCGTLAHQDCFVGLGKCPTLGCLGSLPFPQGAQQQPRASTAERVLDLLELVPRAMTDHHWACLLLGMLLGLGLTLIFHKPARPVQVSVTPPVGTRTAEQLRKSVWDYRRERGQLPQALSQVTKRGAPPSGYTLAQTPKRLFLIWRDFDAQAFHAMEVAPLASALSTVAPVASVASGD